MLDRLLKYWPVITVAALAVVSVFNIGYFTILGFHFIGVMDLSNIVYPVGLVFSLMIVPVIFFPEGLISIFDDIASSPDAAQKLNRARKFITFGIGIFFTIGLFVHRPLISITGLFAVTFLLGFVAFAVVSYIMYLHADEIPTRVVVIGGAFAFFTVFWIGAAVAYHEAFGTNSLYLVTTKDAVYDRVRLARSSSSGFLIAQEKRVIYIPSGEVKSIISIEPIDKNP
jgi:hypothetical protein